MIQKLAILGTVGAGVAIGLMWPTAHSAADSPDKAEEVVLYRNSDGHYYADARVDGRNVHFMVDTGASETALTEADARDAGLPVDPSRYQVIGDGASGMVRGQYVQVKSIELNGIRQNDARVAIVPAATVSLLGQPFLEKVDEIVIRKSEMRLRTGASL